MLVACSQPTKVEVPEPVEGSTIALSQIDTLMWHQPDSALAVMMEFAGSEAADSLDVFEGHYCQVLISELLYKNYYSIILMVWGIMSATALLRPAGNTSMPYG